MSGNVFVIQRPRSGVSSLTGTTNQVIVSNPVGAITLSLPQNIDTGAHARLGSLGLGEAASSTVGVFLNTLGADGVTGLRTKRFTDTTPTGKFLEFQKADSTPLFTCDIDGTITSSGQFISTVATGASPFVVSSTTLVSNLYVARSALSDTVTTNANLTGPITSVGNSTSIASQTGTGTKFVVDTSPTLITPNIGVATATSVNSLTLTSQSVGFTISGGTTSKTLTADASLSLSNVALLDAANTFSSSTGQSMNKVLLPGSTSGTLTVLSAAIAGTSTLTLPGGTTDFSSTGGSSQVVKQTSSGGAFTVAQLAASDLSNGTSGTGAVALVGTPTFTTSIITPLIIGGTSSSSALSLQSTSGVGSSDAIIFNVGNNGATEAMRIITSGFVGIGTTLPTAKLHIVESNPNVFASMTFEHTATTGGGASALFWMKSKSGDTSLVAFSYSGGGNYIQSGNYAFNGNQPLLITGANGSVGTTLTTSFVTTIFSGGRVGIGNTAPSVLLDLGLAGTTAGVINLAGHASGNVTIYPSEAAGTWVWTLPTNGGTAAGQFLQTNGSGATSWATGGLLWTEVTGTTQSMVASNGYIANNDSLVTLTLPSSAALGDIIEVVGKGAGGWKIAQGSGQTIHFGYIDTSTGTSGYLASTNRYDAIAFRCITANTDFAVLGSQGNINVV